MAEKKIPELRGWFRYRPGGKIYGTTILGQAEPAEPSGGTITPPGGGNGVATPSEGSEGGPISSPIQLQHHAVKATAFGPAVARPSGMVFAEGGFLGGLRIPGFLVLVGGFALGWLVANQWPKWRSKVGEFGKEMRYR